jgi:hypothetical protein
MRGQSVREEVVADRMSFTETRGVVLPEGQLNVQDRDPISTVKPMRKRVFLYTRLGLILQTDTRLIRHGPCTHLVVVGAMFDLLSIQVD